MSDNDDPDESDPTGADDEEQSLLTKLRTTKVALQIVAMVCKMAAWLVK